MDFNIVDELLGFTLLGAEWVLWLLLALSVLSIAITIERLVFFSKMKIDFAQFSKTLNELLSKGDESGAIELCEASPAIECQVTLRALEQKNRGVDAIEKTVDGYLIGEKQHMDRWLVVLGTLGNNAPFIGLFGTVIGIIQAFNDLASNPAGGPSMVMAGISEALVATAVGLFVAIPAVIAYNGFGRVVKRRLANAEAVKKIITSHFAVMEK